MTRRRGTAISSQPTVDPWHPSRRCTSLNTEVDHADMDLTNIWRPSLQQPVPDLTGIGRSAFLRALRFPRRVRGIRTRLLSEIRLLPGIPLLLLGIWLLSAICVSALWILRPALLLGKPTICSAGVLQRLAWTWPARVGRPLVSLA